MFPFAGSPSSSEPSSSKSKVNLAVVLQVNATIIVGMLLLLTLSDTFLIPNFPEYHIVDFPLPDYIVPVDPTSIPGIINYTIDYQNFLAEQHIEKIKYDLEVQKGIDEGQKKILDSTIIAIFPFVSSSVLILAKYVGVPGWKEGRKGWLAEMLPVMLTGIGMIGILIFFVHLQDILNLNVDVQERVSNLMQS